MAMSKKEIQEVIEKLPNDKLELLSRYIEELTRNVKKDEFEESFQYAMNNYSNAFKGLKDR